MYSREAPALLKSQAAELLCTPATHRDSSPVDELRLEVPARVTLERADVVEIHNVCTMNAHESLWIESRFKPA